MDGDADEREARTDEQRAHWSAVATGWRAWWPVFEAGAGPLSARMLDLARLAPGARVLDVATGIGEPALGAARRVGPRGSVLALDLAPEMIAIARERAAAAELANVELAVADAQDLALAPASFDAALSRWGLMLLPEPERALAGIRSALRADARFVAAVWATAERVPFIAIPRAVGERELGLERPPPGAPGPLRLGRSGDLEALLERAGFRSIETETVAVGLEFADADEFARFTLELSSALRAALEARPRAAQERARAALVDAARAHATAGGRIRFANESIVAVARR